MVKPYSTRQLTREERIAHFRNRDRRVVENDFGILVSRFRVLLGTMEQKPRIAIGIIYTCVVLHNMLRTHQGRADRAPTPANDVAALQNKQVVYVPKDNYRNPLREAKLQRDLLKTTSIMWEHWPGRRTEPWGQKKLASISPFEDYPIFLRTFI